VLRVRVWGQVRVGGTNLTAATFASPQRDQFASAVAAVLRVGVSRVAVTRVQDADASTYQTSRHHRRLLQATQGVDVSFEVPHSSPSPLPQGFGFQQHRRRPAERRHPAGRERMNSSTLQTLQDPILLTPWLCFEVAAFQTSAPGGMNSVSTTFST
jgi:hypothetical protein